MFGFGKKKYAKKFAKGNDFLKSHATKIGALMRYTEENELVTEKLNKLKEDFVFTISPAENREVRKHENAIERKYKELKEILEMGEWDEKDVLRRINSLGGELDEINSIR